MKRGRVNDLLLAYKNNDMLGVKAYLEDSNIIIEDYSWVGKMKRLLDSKKIISMEAEIASLFFIFNLTDKNGTKNLRICD